MAAPHSSVWGGKSRLFSKCMLLLYDPAAGLYGGNKGGKLRDFDKTRRQKSVSADSNSDCMHAERRNTLTLGYYHNTNI